MGIMVRVADPAEWAVVARLVGDLLIELSGGTAVDRAGLEQVAAGLLRSRQVVALVAYDGPQAVGVLTLNPCAAIYAGGAFGEISELYVQPAHRSAGVAARLLAAARDYGAAQGWKRLEVGAPPQLEWARTLAFYQREGFEETGPRLRLIL